jgi:tetratricopeptide (TPR) repeat protein
MALGQGPNFDELKSQATAAREQNNIPRAIELYSQAVEHDPKWPEGWWFLGLLEYGGGSYAAAREALSRFIELTSDAGPATALRGLCEFETGEYPQALTDIQRGISLGAANQPRNAQILRYHEGLLLTKLGRFEDALKSYAYFAQNRITSPELLLAVGLAGLRMPLLPKDAPSEQQPILTAAGNAAFQYMAGDEEGAAQAFEDLFRSSPAVHSAHYLYGSLLYSSEPDAAIVEFKRELEAWPDNESAQVMTAWALLMRNHPSDALPFAEKAARAEPALSAAQLALGRALAETGSPAEGIAHLERALQLEPNNLETHIALAKAYSLSGRKADAQRERQLCLQMTKDETTQVAQP